MRRCDAKRLRQQTVRPGESDGEFLDKVRGHTFQAGDTVEPDDEVGGWEEERQQPEFVCLARSRTYRHNM